MPMNKEVDKVCRRACAKTDGERKRFCVSGMIQLLHPISPMRKDTEVIENNKGGKIAPKHSTRIKRTLKRWLQF